MDNLESTLGVGIKDIQQVEVGSEEYHQIPAVSNSMLKAYAEDPETCWERYVAKVAEQKSSRAFDFGKRIERMVFFDETPNAVVVPESVMQKRKKSGSDTEFTYARTGQAYTGWCEEMRAAKGADVLFLNQEEYDKTITPLLIARDRLQEHEAACKLLWGEGDPHITYTWTDTSAGFDLPCKCQLDILSAIDVIVDLKSASPANCRTRYDWERHVWEYRYHWQAWWYRHAVYAATGKLMPFVFVVVQSEAPFRVFVYEPEDSWYAMAEFQLRKQLSRLAESWRTNVWRPIGWGKVVKFKPSFWMERSLEEED